MNPHFDLLSHSGRGAPEIDIFEGMAGPSEKLPNTKIKKPYFSTSLQVSPGVSNPRPVLTHKPLPGKWYEGMSYGTNSSLNNFFYGVQLKHTPEQYTYQSDAISANTAIEPKVSVEVRHLRPFFFEEEERLNSHTPVTDSTS